VDPAALEKEIGARLDAGDWNGAVTVAFRGYGGEVLRYIVTVLRDRDRAEAQDLAGELFLSLVEHRSAFERRASFRGFMYAVARNLALTALRNAARRPVVRLDSQAEEQLVEEVRTRTREWLRTPAKDALADIRAGLDVEEQTLLVLIVDRKMSSDEVARALSDPDRPVNAAAVRKRFARLRRKLRVQLEERGLT
jgi:RNA polymerase sigma factor (sigma-70 family)